MVTPGKTITIRTRFFRQSCKSYDFSGWAWPWSWPRISIAGVGGRIHVHNPEGAGADHVQYAGIVINLLQEGLYGLQFCKFAVSSLIFHMPEFVIKLELL